MENRLMNIEIGRINPSPRNPRKTVSKEELAELAQNIKAQGLLQPITVRPVDFTVLNKDGSTTQKDFEIVCGERRYRAVYMNANGNEKETIACIVKEMTDEEAFEAMITENLQRKDVDPLEEAFAFGELIKTGRSVDEIADRFGKSKRFVQERCKLNTLIDPLKKLTSDGIIPIAGAIMLAKLKDDLQNKYNKDLQDKIKRNAMMINVSTQEISTWVTREFMRLKDAMFLVYDKDDSQPPTEDWNTRFEKCATCPMNTGNAGCLFYSMNNTEHNCTDRQCFEDKTAAYMLWKIEQDADRLARKGKRLQFGDVVIVCDQTEECYGYDNVKRVRKNLLKMIKDKGYMVASPDKFNGLCKYYGDDERIPQLLKQNKVYECITLGTPWCLQVETRYYYAKGIDDTEPEGDPIEKEAKELAAKYERLLDSMNWKANEELAGWCKDKQYSERKGTLGGKEELSFWSFVVMLCGDDVLKDTGATEYMNQEKIWSYVKNNLTEENKARWQRSFISKFCFKNWGYNNLVQRAMRECFRIAYPKPFEELTKKYADQFEKKSEKIRLRLEELGYNVHGEKQ